MWARISERIDDLAAFALCSLIFCLVRTLAVPTNRSFRSFIFTLFVSVPCGTLAGALLLEVGYGDYACLVLTAIISIFSDRMILWLLDGRRIDDLDAMITNIINKYTK